MSGAKVVLIAPDRSRCQAEVSTGVNAFTLGGHLREARVRCNNVPTCIAKERKPGSDGLRGSMSLCDRCKSKIIEQLGADYAAFSALKGGGKKALRG